MISSFRFFVSFSSRDLKQVREIMAALEGQKLNFWDYSAIVESIVVGENIDKRLSHEIDICTHMVVVISKNSMDKKIGRFCRFELEYALQRNPSEVPHFIPVLIRSNKTPRLLQIVSAFCPSIVLKRSHKTFRLKSPYDIFKQGFCHELDESVESIVKLTVKVCQLIDKVYIPPIEAHAKLPFWEFFRKEVEIMAHSNQAHVEIMMILGEFNEFYKKSDMQKALSKIDFFLISCENRVPNYKPFYPWIVKGVCETELGMYDEAMKSYEKAKKVYPNNLHVMGGIGTVYFHTKEYLKAKNCFEQVIKHNKKEDVTNARINLIITNQALEVPVIKEEEIFLFSVNIDLFPDDLKTSILNAQAVQYRINHNYVELEKHCRLMMYNNLHDTITIRLFQLSYLNRGMKMAASEVIKKAIQETENNPRLNKSDLMSFFN